MYPVVKRFFDILLALGLMVILFPFLFLIALSLWIQNSGSPWFTQTRSGIKGKLFTIYKFKTMRDTRDVQGELLPDFERITPLGLWVRKLSLDELPQLINVLSGQMSFVGPRPLLPEYLPLYSPEQNRRHEVKPGISGWAQVNGRNAISWEEKFKLDVYYVDNQSLLLDLKIIVLTCKKVLMSKNIDSDNQTTMEKFKGSL